MEIEIGQNLSNAIQAIALCSVIAVVAWALFR